MELVDVEAMRADFEAKLNEKSDEIARLIREHGEEVGVDRQIAAQLRSQVSSLERILKEERTAHDTTKGELMEALLQAERLRGYVNALEDLRPPRMVEEVRQPRGYDRDPVHRTYDPTRRPAPFYSRGG